MRVEISAVSAGFGARLVLEEVSLGLEPGSVTVVLGPNGAGKSTLVRVVAGLLRPRSGTVTFGELDLTGAARSEVARRVALVPQRSEIPEGFTVRAIVSMGRAPHQDRWQSLRPDDRRVVAEALAACELEALAERPFEALSGGEQQRVQLARALAQTTPVLLLDEAAAHLDVRHAVALHRRVRDLVRERGLACLAAMHDLNAAARFGDRVLLLREGRVVALGTPDEVMTAELLERTFGVAIEVGRRPDGRPMFSAA
ncbi:MAG: ABC transporter ATP-binding protein [Deltaproteobacteria bacterium]|nr:ABC transporter ATP-binding protein [Deltaproteobacteria bacterium]